MHPTDTLSTLNTHVIESMNAAPRYRISRDRSFRLGDYVRSYDFPHDQRHRDCYVEGFITSEPSGYEQRVTIEVVKDMYCGKNMSLTKRGQGGRLEVSAPTGRGMFFNRHCLFKLEAI